MPRRWRGCASWSAAWFRSRRRRSGLQARLSFPCDLRLPVTMVFPRFPCRCRRRSGRSPSPRLPRRQAIDPHAPIACSHRQTKARRKSFSREGVPRAARAARRRHAHRRRVTRRWPGTPYIEWPRTGPGARCGGRSEPERAAARLLRRYPPAARSPPTARASARRCLRGNSADPGARQAAGPRRPRKQPAFRPCRMLPIHIFGTAHADSTISADPGLRLSSRPPSSVTSQKRRSVSSPLRRENAHLFRSHRRRLPPPALAAPRPARGLGRAVGAYGDPAPKADLLVVFHWLRFLAGATCSGPKARRRTPFWTRGTLTLLPTPSRPRRIRPDPLRRPPIALGVTAAVRSTGGR